MDLQAIGRILVFLGIGIVLIGGLFLLIGRFSILSNLGHLPGDIRIEKRGFACLLPLTSMILVSVILSIVLNILVRLINK